MSVKDQQRFRVLALLHERHITAREAAEMVGLCVRQVRRLLVRYRAEGAPGIVHRNRGRQPAHALTRELVARIAQCLAEPPYSAANNHHARELLAEHEGIEASVSSIRRVRRAAGLSSPRKRRPPKPHPPRDRKPQAGMMLLIDASKHHWFGPSRPPCHLLAAIDDATNEVFAIFRQEEDTVGYVLLLQQVVKARGVPLVLYSDHRTLFGSPGCGSVQPAPSGPGVQFARICQELGIHQSFANSPQAKGRVERLFGTLQGRLPIELELRDAHLIDDANRLLPGLLKRHNHRFRKTPDSPDSAYRPAPDTDVLRHILALRFPRTVANDNTVSFGGRCLLLRPKPDRSYAGKTVEVLVEPNGRISFSHHHACIGQGPKVRPPASVRPSDIVADLPTPSGPTPSPEPPRPRREPVVVRPPPDHPWRRSTVRPPKQPTVQSNQPVGG